MPQKHWSFADVLRRGPRAYEPEVAQRSRPQPVSTRVARSEAQRLVKALGLAVPVDVEAVCAFVGARVHPMEEHEGLGEAVGRYVGGGILEVRNDLHPWVRRVTVAHELGHHVLHHDIRNRWEAAPRLPYRGPDPHETEAWAFAGELLMPASQIGLLLASGTTPSALARTLQVTRPFLFAELARRRLLSRVLPEGKP